jgi:hypothetical protein
MQGNLRGVQHHCGQTMTSPEMCPAVLIQPRPGFSRGTHHHTSHRQQPRGLVPQRVVPRNTREQARRNHAMPRLAKEHCGGGLQGINVCPRPFPLQAQ